MVIEIYYWYGKNILILYISEKLFVYNDRKEVIGVMWNVKLFNILFLLKYIN